MCLWPLEHRGKLRLASACLFLHVESTAREIQRTGMSRTTVTRSMSSRTNKRVHWVSLISRPPIATIVVLKNRVQLRPVSPSISAWSHLNVGARTGWAILLSGTHVISIVLEMTTSNVVETIWLRYISWSRPTACHSPECHMFRHFLHRHRILLWGVPWAVWPGQLTRPPPISRVPPPMLPLQGAS